MDSLPFSPTLDNYLQIMNAAQASHDGQRCMIPPHPDLKKKIIEDLANFRRQYGDNVLFNRLIIGGEHRPGVNDGLIRPGNTFPLGTPLQVARSSRSQQPLRGNLKVLVVLVDFSDAPMNTPKSHFDDLFFSLGQIPTGSVKEYYREVTNNLVDISGDVVGPYRLPAKLTDYANGASGMGTVLPNAQTMAKDAALAIGNAINLQSYDNDGDGYVDAFIVVHAGTGAETTNNPNDIWSHKWLVEGGPYKPAGQLASIYGYLTVPEDCRLGVCAHELGHLLFGFPDLYDTTNASEGIGDWCLMSSGSWNNNGLTPSHPSAWCKCNQQWVTITIPGANQAGLIIPDVKTGFRVWKLWKGGNPGTEYFLLENRQQAKFDQYNPGAGLLIWHVDDSVTDNSTKPHYRVALEQADGQQDLEKNNNRGDAGDPYPGTTANNNFTVATIPGSLSYGGVDSSVAVNNIQLSGSDIQCDIQVV